MTRPLKTLTQVREMERMCAPPPSQGARLIYSRFTLGVLGRQGWIGLFWARENILKECCCDKEVP